MAQTRHTMKKIFLSFALLLSFTGAVFAQTSMLATLSHEGEITVFYGANALKEAHAVAQHGDAITLSSGSFNATNITKAITLRGAGMEIDTLKNTYPTIINSDFSILIGDNVSEKLTIEGIYSDGNITISNGLNNASFLKNILGSIKYTASGDTIQYQNNRYIHCKVVDNFIAPDNSDNSSFSFTNSYICSIENNNCNSIFTNCIINNSYFSSYSVNNRNISNLSYCTFYNCILIGSSNTSASSGKNILDSTNQAYNCIATNIFAINCTNSNNNTFYNIPNQTNSCIESKTSVFKSFNLTYKDDETFELVDNIKTKYTGTDGTEIGIHGGSLPFSPTPTNPQITKCNVASRSTADGKLSVDIEVKAGE